MKRLFIVLDFFLILLLMLSSTTVSCRRIFVVSTCRESKSFAFFRTLKTGTTTTPNRSLPFGDRKCYSSSNQATDPKNNNHHQWMKVSRGGGGDGSSSSIIDESNTTYNRRMCCKYRVYLAVGSNLGHRFNNIATALDMLCDHNFDRNNYESTRLVRTSFLHSTAPMYVTDQPEFLNGAVEIETDMDPHSLLRRIKKVEKGLGRDLVNAQRNGPRPVDLDILFYDHYDFEKSDEKKDRNNNQEPILLDSPDLIIPHPLMQERDFVLTPLKEVAGEEYYHPKLNLTIASLLDQLLQQELSNNDDDNSSSTVQEDNKAVRVIPLPRGRMIWFNETLVMGILNVTPDSFSDGGKWNDSVDLAVQHALEMISNGASIIDIGGESTRPGAKEIPIPEQIKRTIPVIQEVRKVSNIPISIDTRHSEVARAAVEAGADIVNDVSGGTFDPEMLSVVSDLKVPMILMHMRGTPESMQTMTEYKDNNVCEEVTEALLERSSDAEKAGIHRWLQILDPGIGFAKDFDGNLLLLKHTTTTIRTKLQGIPLLLGTSRKGFIGKITGETKAEERDYGSVASVITALCYGASPSVDLGCNILRVHNVKGTKQATRVMDAISNVR